MKNSVGFDMRPADGRDCGISANDLDIIAGVLEPYEALLDAVGLFGSRATGRFTVYSDIDLVIHGRISQSDVLRINTEFRESSISKSVDVCSYSLVDAKLRGHIDRVYRPLWQRRSER